MYSTGVQLYILVRFRMRICIPPCRIQHCSLHQMVEQESPTCGERCEVTQSYCPLVFTANRDGVKMASLMKLDQIECGYARLGGGEGGRVSEPKMPKLME